MADVVFVTPNIGGAMVEESLGTLQLATILQEKGISCELLPFFKIGDVDDFEHFIENALSLLQQRKCRIVSFYTRCDSYHIVLRIAQRLKERCKEMYTVFGGPQSDIVSEETVRQLPFVDFVCCGEGETTIYPFFRSLLSGTPDLSVPGLVYREGDQVRKNPRPALLEDLDSLPMVDYSLLGPMEGEGDHPMSIDVGRGCPFGCTFCSTKSFWGRKYRLKSPQRICDEVKLYHQRCGGSLVEFAHDMFTMNRAKVIETCRLLKQLDFPLKWCCSARLDCVDEELINIMADAGMISIYFGIETGSPRMQKLIHKNLDLESAQKLVEYTASKGVYVTTSFIYGFPEETEEDLSMTMDLMSRIMRTPKAKVHAHLCAFMAGTELSRRYREELTPTQVYSDQTGEHAVEACKDLILGYPELFQHMLEYKTPLRTALRHFALFFRVWTQLRPVYQYFLTKYPANRLIDLYYDFVEANQEVLEYVYDMKANWSTVLIQKDRLWEKFKDDENIERIRDLYRFAQMESSAEQRRDSVQMFGIDPEEAQEKDLRDCQPCVCVITWKHGRKQKVKYPYRQA